MSDLRLMRDAPVLVCPPGGELTRCLSCCQPIFRSGEWAEAWDGNL